MEIEMNVKTSLPAIGGRTLIRTAAATSLLAATILAGATSLAVAGPKTHDTELDLIRGAKRLMIQTDAAPVNYTSTSYVQVTAGTIDVPAAQTGILVAKFTAESN